MLFMYVICISDPYIRVSIQIQLYFYYFFGVVLLKCSTCHCALTHSVERIFHKFYLLKAGRKKDVDILSS